MGRGSANTEQVEEDRIRLHFDMCRCVCMCHVVQPTLSKSSVMSTRRVLLERTLEDDNEDEEAMEWEDVNQEHVSTHTSPCSLFLYKKGQP